MKDKCHSPLKNLWSNWKDRSCTYKIYIKMNVNKQDQTEWAEHYMLQRTELAGVAQEGVWVQKTSAGLPRAWMPCAPLGYPQTQWSLLRCPQYHREHRWASGAELSASDGIGDQKSSFILMTNTIVFMCLSHPYVAGLLGTVLGSPEANLGGGRSAFL